MSNLNGNSGTTVANNSVTQRKNETVQAPPAPLPEGAETLALFTTGDGTQWRGMPLRFTRHSVVFELYNPGATPRLSEVLAPFQLAVQRRSVYNGRAVVTKLVESGSKIICEADLDEKSWTAIDPVSLARNEGALAAEFQLFVGEWQKLCAVSAEFKLVLADMQSFLHDLRLWLDQIEVGLRTLPSRDQKDSETELGRKILRAVQPLMDSLFERFETVCGKISPDAYSAHRTYCHRQLHPLLMCCPFMYRIFAKPLGYAGDYEMIDMIIRNQLEGDSLFAKILQAYILDQAPAVSVRNRANYFVKRFVEETVRVSRYGRPASFFSLGCGPAREVEQFFREHPLAEKTRFSLLDFSAETLKQTAAKLQQVKQETGRKTPVATINKSVNHILKESGKSVRPAAEHDMIYCSGLYDYLSDRVCQQLNSYLYDQLKPGGLLVVTNFDPSNPIRNIMEYIFEWFLIHRDSPHLATLAPEQASPDDCRVIADATGCNVFLEVRKPL